MLAGSEVSYYYETADKKSFWPKSAVKKTKKNTIAAGNRQPNFELGILNFDLFSASPTILNYSIFNWKISFY